MLLLLLALGIVLVALGILVLLRFPDRPGGHVRVLGAEVTSIGAGLPLITLGVVVVVAAVALHDQLDDAPKAAPPPSKQTAAVADDAGDSRSAARAARAAEARSSSVPAALENADIRLALKRGVAAARTRGGSVQAAVWVEGSDEPVVAEDRRALKTRPWGMIRAATSIAVLRAGMRGGRVTGSPMLMDALRGSLVRGENCAQQRAVLGLHQLTGGLEAGRVSVEDVFRDANATTFIASRQDARADISCNAYLRSAGSGLADPVGNAIQFGRSSWSIRDAIALAHALGTAAYGDAGRVVLGLMREPKARSTDAGVDPSQYTPPTLDWGAGRVFARWNPAYVQGWGGATSNSTRYLVGQVGVVDVARRNIAIAAVFQPRDEPSREDPGATEGPQALEALFSELAERFAAAERG